MKFFRRNRRALLPLLVQLAVYGLPFLGFYLVADLVETLKQPVLADQHNGTLLEQWLTQHNQTKLMQYLLLLLVLSFWAFMAQLFHRNSVHAQQEWVQPVEVETDQKKR